MAMKTRILLSATALCLAASGASALDFGSGMYVSVFGGVNNAGNANVDVTGFYYDDTASTRYKNGRVMGLSFGTEMIPGLRGELELSQRTSDISAFYEGGFSGSTASSGDSMKAFAVMLNVWKDVPLGANTSLHFGGGVGMTRLSLKMDDPINYSDASISDSASVAAGQIGVGIDFNVGNGVKVGLDYRYFATGKGNFDAVGEYDSGNFKQGYRDQAVLLSIRIPLGGN
jgi:outer membrane immunogenic protein